MRKHTLRAFIDNYKGSSYHEIPGRFQNWQDLSRETKIKLTLESADAESFYRKDDALFFVLKRYTLKRVANTFFMKSSIVMSIYVDTKTVRMHDCSFWFIRKFLDMAGIDWLHETPLYSEESILTASSSLAQRILQNTSILKSILCGNIYNSETLYKAALKRVFKVNMSWKAFRDLLVDLKTSGGYIPSMLDLQTFTTSLEHSIKVWCSSSHGKRHLLEDMLADAIRLDEKVNFSWSDKRLKEEHQRQIDELMEREISAKSKIKIFENLLPENKHITLLNSEYEVFLEGKRMSHCIYTNYFYRMLDHTYMAFHMTYPEECTVGVRLNTTTEAPYIEQMYKAYNMCVDTSTKAYMTVYFQEHLEEITQMFKQKPVRLPE